MTERLRICFVTSMHDWNDDRIFERAAVGLASLGHEVIFVAPADRDKVIEGVQIRAIPKRKRIGKHLFGPREAFTIMKTIEADAYYFFNPNMMIRMRRWAKKGYAVFADIHENYEVRVNVLPLPKWLRKIAVKRYRKFENRLCSSYRGITVVTESMKRKLEPSGVPILVVDNVPYLKRLGKVELSEVKSPHPTIITSGNNSSARNCMKAVEALPAIVKEIPDVVMKFVGKFTPPEYEKELINKAAELGVSDHFKTEGSLPWLENFKRISSAHIGCVFYDDNLNNRVTLPNRLYEYMFVGLAVLGEEFPEVKKVIEATHCGATVNSQLPEDIARKSIELLKSTSRLNQSMHNARQAVLEKYNFEHTLADLDLFIRKYSKI